MNFKWVLIVRFFFLLCLLVFFQCKDQSSNNTIENSDALENELNSAVKEEDSEKAPEKLTFSLEKIPKNYQEVKADTLGILIDLRYATENNFMKQKIYDCGRCFLRKEIAEKIFAIQTDLKERYGFGLKLFDCYRPSEYQEKLWEIKPDPNYVTPPKKGSVHSRGMAVDLTIVDKKGNELNMGTAFDYFGAEAHTDFQDLPDEVLKNRQLLKKMMENYGFKGIRTEWWHYSYRSLKGKLDHWNWACD
ncbi:MAG: M15 family metallopeptidase [Saprospiraceae bacterium]